MILHMDQAWEGAASAARGFADAHPEVRVLLIENLLGRLSAAVLGPPPVDQALIDALRRSLEEASGPYWSGDLWQTTGDPDQDEVLEEVWDGAQRDDLSERLRIADRVRSRGAWFQEAVAPPWDWAWGAPRIIVFYSFKGGVGRSTALAAFAIQRARAGERVVVVDLDLGAPGVGNLLAADAEGQTAPWGAADYLLEREVGIDLADYYHACRREPVTGAGEILVVPAGRVDGQYLDKVARLDLEPPADPDEPHPVRRLLETVRDHLKPQWILLDARTGLSEPAGVLLGGHAHLHVLFGTTSAQSWNGIRIVVERLGRRLVREGRSQLDTLLVQALVPEAGALAREAKTRFLAHAQTLFETEYYAEDPEGEEEGPAWYIRDAEQADAPHVPVTLSYRPRLAHFDDLAEVADELADSPEYQALGNRILGRFIEAAEEDEPR